MPSARTLNTVITTALVFAVAAAVLTVAFVTNTYTRAVVFPHGAAAVPPCRIERIGQVAHLTVRLAPSGELLATCNIVTGRKS